MESQLDFTRTSSRHLHNSLDLLRLVTMNTLRNVEAFIITFLAFIRIFEGSTTPNTPYSLTIRAGEATKTPNERMVRIA